VRLSKPSIAFISNVTGDWITAQQATDSQYWVDHLRNSVKFSDGIQTLAADNFSIYLEVGPGTTLCGLASVNGVTRKNVIPSIGLTKPLINEYSEVLSAIKSLWLHDIQLDWMELYGQQKPRRITLPTYAFDRQSYWIQPTTVIDNTISVSSEKDYLSNTQLSTEEANLSRPGMQSNFLAAQTSRQAGLVDLWQSMLGINGIGINDNYFELGGDSLTGIALVKRMNIELDMDVPIDAFMQLGTIRSIANYADILGGQSNIDELSDEEVNDLLEVI